MNVIVILIALVLTLLAWASVFRVVPACANSTFRYRLWQLRDEVFDEILRGEYDDLEQPRAFVKLAEASIENAADLSVFKVWTLHLVSRGMPLPDIFHLDGLSPGDRGRLRPHLRNFEGAVIKKALGGTPSGWAVLAALGSIAVVESVSRRVRGEMRSGASVFADAKWHVREDFEMDAAVAMMKRPSGRRRVPLYRQV